MARPASRQPVLPDLIDLAAQMRQDQDRERTWLWRRDREVGRALTHLQHRPAAQVVAWLDRVADGPRPGERAARVQRFVVLVLIVLGFVVGWMTAAAVFFYTGDRPVNVVGVLAVFVGLQLLLLGLYLIAALPDALLRRVPGAEPVVEAVRVLSPGRLAPLIVRLLPQSQRDAVTFVLSRGQAHQRQFAGVEKWMILTWSQIFAVMFNVGALLRYLYLVFFSDLAFVWSTTLRTDASAFHSLTAVAAWPWAWALPQAVPSFELVRDTRYFRLDDGALAGATSAVDPGYFGGWWPFLLMCLLIYGLLPRVVTLAFSARRLRRATAAAVLHTPGVSSLLDRLNSEWVQTQSPEAAEPAGPAAGAVAEIPVEPADVPPESVRAFVNWSSVPLSDDELRALASRPNAAVHPAGGSRTLDEDRATIQRIAAVGAPGAVVMAVKSWEPPVLEVLDFAADLRAALGEAVPIVVIPIAEGEMDPVHLAQWRRRFAAAGDPWLSVVEALQ